MNPTHSIYPIERKFQIQAFHSCTDPHWEPDFVFSGEVHDYWEMMYVAEGSVEVTQHDRIYRLSAGDLILHAPGKFHSVRSAATSFTHITTFSVQGELPLQLGEGFFPLSAEDGNTVLTLYSCIGDFVRGGAGSSYAGQECADRLSVFLVGLIHHHAVCRERLETPDTRIYRKLVGIMHDALYSNDTVADIAARVPVSTSYMKVLFHRYAGMAPKQYYSRLRLTEAVRMLQSGLSASDTAERMKFSSPNYFSCFVKKMTGQPPSFYGKRQD